MIVEIVLMTCLGLAVSTLDSLHQPITRIPKIVGGHKSGYRYDIRCIILTLRAADYCGYRAHQLYLTISHASVEG